MKHRFPSATEQRFGKIFGSSLAIAALSLAIAGCSSSTADTTTPVDNTVMQADSSSSVDAMMPADGTSSSSWSATSSESAMAPSAAAYKDGTFAATGGYQSPAGPETVDVSLTLKNGTITDATFKGNATGPMSIKNQGKFAAGFKEQVVGKSIDSLSLGVVNGSSLTPKGFMDAVEKIKAEAHSA
jgi:uncharacterized protein with FMN-binding domain